MGNPTQRQSNPMVLALGCVSTLMSVAFVLRPRILQIHPHEGRGTRAFMLMVGPHIEIHVVCLVWHHLAGCGKWKLGVMDRHYVLASHEAWQCLDRAGGFSASILCCSTSASGRA